MRTSHRSTALLTGGALLAGTTTAGLVLAPAAGAQTLTVTNTNDSGAGSLRQAIIDANATPGTDTITFAPTVTGTITLASNLTPIEESVVITGPGADRLAIDGSRRYSGFTQSLSQPVAISLDVSGLRLQRLHADTAPFFGAIVVLDGDLTLRDTIVTDSGSPTLAQSYADAPVVTGVFNNQALTGNVLLERVTITGNHSYEGPNTYASLAGAAILAGAEVTVRDSTITDNSADLAGGAFLIGLNVTVSNSTFADNRSRGPFGALMARGDTMSIEGSRVTGNSGLNQSGISAIGGFYSSSPNGATSIAITDTLIADNTARAGSVNYLEAANVTVERTTITGNRSADAPAPETEPASALSIAGAARIQSSTITQNVGIGLASFTRRQVASCGPTTSSATTQGLLRNRRSLGACAVAPATPATPGESSLLVRHSTIADNASVGVTANRSERRPLSTTSDGLAPKSTSSSVPQPTISIDHAIIAGNGVGATGLDIDSPFTSRFSLVQRPFATHTDGAGGGNIFGVDPQLQPLQWYSSVGAVRPILGGSPAWNAGDPAFTPPPATDQTGAPRVVEIIDMGAYEVQAETFAPRFAG